MKPSNIIPFPNGNSDVRDKKEFAVFPDSVSISNSKEYNINEVEIKAIYEGVLSLLQQSSGKEDKTMDETLKLLLERFERDAREREERYHNDAREREERYRQEMLEQDRRFRQEAKEREERIINSINEIKQDVRNELKEVKEDVRSSKNTLITLAISTIIGIAAMVIGALIAVFIK